MKDYFSYDLPKEVEELARAVVLLHSRLKAAFWDTLTFDQWRGICRFAKSNSELKTKALSKLLETAESFDQWHAIWQESHQDRPDIAKEAKAKLVRLAQTYKQCYWLLHIETISSSDEKSILNKIAHLGTTDFHSWYEIATLSRTRPNRMKFVLKKMAELASTSYDWLAIYVRAKKDVEPELRRVALRKMIESAQTTKQPERATTDWEEIFEYLDASEEIESDLTEKLIEHAPSFYDLIKAFKSARDNQLLRQKAVIRMLEGEWGRLIASQSAFYLVGNDPGLREVIASKMIERVTLGKREDISEYDLEQAMGDIETAVEKKMEFWDGRPENLRAPIHYWAA